MDHEAIDNVLKQTAWIRTVARRLVADVASRDALVQRVWREALQRGRRARAVRPCLFVFAGSVERSELRGSAHRRSCEEANQLSATDLSDKLIERVKLERALASAILELAEPFRSTFLLRYCANLSQTEASRHLKVPVSTVRWQIKHAVELLRNSLDAKYRDRRRWAIRMIPAAAAARTNSAHPSFRLLTRKQVVVHLPESSLSVRGERSLSRELRMLSKPGKLSAWSPAMRPMHPPFWHSRPVVDGCATFARMGARISSRGISSIALATLVSLSPFDLNAAGTANMTAISIPHTPAGKTLKAWLDAFNSGDRARMAAYCAQTDPETSADDMMSFYKHTGGVELIGVDKSERLHIEFRLRDKATPTVGVGKLDVKDGNPSRVANFSLRAIPPGMTAADMDIVVDATSRSRILDGIVAKLTEYYVYPDVATKMTSALRAHQKNGEYDAVTDGDAFAELLTKQLQTVSHDKHLRVVCVPKVLPKGDPNPDQPMDSETRSQMERMNCGFERVEHLEHNIGYLKFNFFGSPSVCGPTASAAIGFLANVDAVIFDLRQNGGGDPDMVAFMASYLFDERTRLDDIYDRKQNKTTEYWTNPGVPGKKLAGKPVFVLTSKRTFSGAEDFAYVVKNLKRATIIGETTGGGAHPTRPCTVDDHFFVGVPFARSISTITKTNWEGTGVEPDVKVPADQALDVAKKMATERLSDEHKPKR